MLSSLGVSNYRSLLDLAVPLGSLNLITGPNGSGKSNLYRALRLLSETAQSGVITALAREGGLPSKFRAGPENLSKRMREGSVPVRGAHEKELSDYDWVLPVLILATPFRWVCQTLPRQSSPSTRKKAGVYLGMRLLPRRQSSS